jgi:hypothetical protein
LLQLLLTSYSQVKLVPGKEKKGKAIKQIKEVMARQAECKAGPSTPT